MKKLFTVLLCFLFLIKNNTYAQEIFNAILNDDVNNIEKILNADIAQLEIIQQQNMTPLMFAASKGSVKSVEYLIKRGANLNYLTPRGDSPLLFAAMFSHFNIVQLLVKNGATINSGTGQRSPIFKAIEFGTKEIAEYLFEKGAEVPVSNFLFHQSVSKGMNQIMEYMIKNGVDTKSLNANGGNVLHSAAKYDNPLIIKKFENIGLDFNSRDRYGNTPLHIATLNGNTKVIQFLFDMGANLELKDYTGRTSHALAIQQNDNITGTFLVKLGAIPQKLNYMDIPDHIYFGLEEPDTTSKLFAPGIITTEIGEHGAIAISPNLNEIYWQAKGIKFIKKVDGRWTFPDTIALLQKYGASNPAFSHDGNKLYFHSPMSTNNDGTKKDMDIWYVIKTENGWSEPTNLGLPVNTNQNESNPSVASNGNLYFACNNDIYMSEYKEGKYCNRIELDMEINTDYFEGSPCIAPDESFIIFESNRPGGYSFSNLYISFKDNLGKFSKAIILKEDICQRGARFPGLSPDGKFLFFCSLRNGWLDIYWVSSKVIDDLRKESIKNEK